MYHIKTDKRSQRSAQIICEGLAEVLKKKDYHEITISDLCVQTGIARTTFYRLFDIIDDVLLYQFDFLFKESMQKYKDSKEPISYAKIILSTAMNNQTITSILINSGRTDLFDFSTRLNEEQLLSNLHLDIDEKKRLYCTPMLNAMIFAVLKTWIHNGCKENADELYEILRSNILFIIKNM